MQYHRLPYLNFFCDKEKEGILLKFKDINGRAWQLMESGWQLINSDYYEINSAYYKEVAQMFSTKEIGILLKKTIFLEEDNKKLAELLTCFCVDEEEVGRLLAEVNDSKCQMILNRLAE